MIAQSKCGPSPFLIGQSQCHLEKGINQSEPSKASFSLKSEDFKQTEPDQQYMF